MVRHITAAVPDDVGEEAAAIKEEHGWSWEEWVAEANRALREETDD